MTFPLDPGDFSARLVAILEARDSSWSNPDVEEAIWISADATFEADGDLTKLTLSFQVRWNISTNTGASIFPSQSRRFRKSMLAMAFPEIFGVPAEKQANSCSPGVFYEAAHVPNPEDTPPEDTEIPGLTAKLYPFQRRAVRWLLRREGIEWTLDGNGNTITKEVGYSHFDAPSQFIEANDADGQKCFVSPLLGKITKDYEIFRDLEQNFKGGILAEEMGLGKTVEMLALFCLHRMPSGTAEIFDNYQGVAIKPAPGTLIVAPSSLKNQWLSELNKHAPNLRVMHYTGLSSSARTSASKTTTLIEKLASQDVVITTYNVLTSELAYAMKEPERARRAPRKYYRPTSPLTRLCWWRVCMDEAQMIESGVSKSATLARLIPRINSWGVTGTPVKDSVEDLRGLLLFLRYEPFAFNLPAWNALVRHHKDGFKRLFNQLALRHSKRLVRHEIYIPAQKRYVITMPFTAVEEQHYQNLFKEVVEACGLGLDGEPLRDDWDQDDPSVLEAMRTALDRLRQTALHPEVGTRNRRALGHKNGPMRTVAEVLDVMIDQSEVSMRVDQRALLLAKLTRGQFMENSPRVKIALDIWQGVLDVSNAVVEECRKYLRRMMDQAKVSQPNAGGGGDEDKSDEEFNENNTGKVGDARRRLRSALEVQHKAMFFCANAYFQIKSNKEMTDPESDEYHRLEKLETEGYDKAKAVRREILEESRRKALKLMKRISTSASQQSFATIPDYKSLDHHGLESRAIAERLEVLAGELNDQAEQLDEWREHVIQLLLKPLVDEDDEIELTGEEFEDSTKLMEEIVVYVQILRTAIADREAILTGQVNELVNHEAKTSLRQAEAGEGPYPEKLLELFQLRNEVKPQSHGSLRAAVSELRAAKVKIRSNVGQGSKRAQIELEILDEQLHTTQKQLTDQQKVAQAMNQELDLFTATMNARVEFYRQLQGVSDMVAPYEGSMNEAEERQLMVYEETLTKKLDSSQSKHRYLLHLKDMDATDGESRMCIICRENFTIGVLTVCGHQFCKECITLWFKANHNCPVCKKRLNAANLHDITLKPQELKLHSDTPGQGPSLKKFNEDRTQANPAPNKSMIYTEFSSDKLADIRNIDLNGPAFTTKVDNLVRHLLWLRDNDPGAKSIIFSQYADFLSVLGLAFTRYRIGFTSFDRTNGITDFKEDPAIECFLLHARAHSSGLNLVNASHVFLCEPLINTALELQAIARVHRIGQEQETTVWLYIVDGTVEESIYRLSVRRRLEHITDQTRKVDKKGKSKMDAAELADEAIEAANSMELEHASLSKLMGRYRAQGEAVDKGDLWACLFGHVGQQKGNEAGGPGGVGKNPGLAVRGFLAAEAADWRRENI
ncbi:hypothetical protein M406DRAFT_271973 [Cryphonectria parasitica EP155]|uniref:RING-type domain-containing protein n=1 Tax=Cryphonectria parasitica (strain ATCC 38755 / EP155) TaxID=660469 RepID=A0A9P4YBV6_CRYP1|nr:uncharacterized protein M406DRAFT_271973 [Cryphonectria parasitica EP155]KAF3770709.1 hypothetical protein M406DRAFT_271973 [Cryphonectria parasitica EP155]